MLFRLLSEMIFAERTKNAVQHCLLLRRPATGLIWQRIARLKWSHRVRIASNQDFILDIVFALRHHLRYEFVERVAGPMAKLWSLKLQGETRIIFSSPQA